MRARTVAAAVVLLAFLVAHAPSARADALVIDTLELGSWQNAVAALESDLSGQGRSVHVVVHDRDGAALSCGAYALQLDEVGKDAFVLGACDPTTDATLITLVRRDLLFSHDGPIPRPRVVGITAVEVLSGGASGGAGLQGGSTMHCTIDVHPYAVDEEHGTHVPLFAPRFALRVRDANVVAQPTADGWSLGADTSGTLSISYDVVDVQTGEVVVSDSAQLTCAQGGAPSAQPATGVVATGTPWVTGGVSVGISTPPSIPVPVTVHPDVRDPATPQRPDQETMAMWLGTSMRVFGSHTLGSVDVMGTRATLDPMAFATLDFGMRFTIAPWMYTGLEWGMVGYGGAIGDQGSGALAMTFGATLGVRTTGGPVTLYGELLGGGAVLMGDGAVHVDGMPRSADATTFLGLVETRLGVEIALGDGLFTGAHFGIDVLDPSTMEGGLTFGWRA